MMLTWLVSGLTLSSKALFSVYFIVIIHTPRLEFLTAQHALTTHLEGLLKLKLLGSTLRVSNLSGLNWSLRTCIFNKFPSDTHTALLLVFEVCVHVISSV